MSNEHSDLHKGKNKRSQKKNLPFDLSSRAAVAVVFIVMLCAAVIIFVNKSSISPDSAAKNAKFADSTRENAYTDITGSAVLEKNFCATENGLMYISDTSVMQINHDCEKLYSEKHSYTNPMLTVSGKYAVIFSEGSGNYRIIYDKHKIHEGVQGTSITACDINSNGTYGILSDKTGYLSCLTVYNKNNEFIYSYSFSDYYAVCVAVNREGNNIVVGTINSDNGRLISKVYLLDVTSKQPIKTFTYEDQLIYGVKFVSDTHFAVITDFLTSVIKADGSKEIPYTYSSNLLTAYDICYDNSIVLSLSKSDDGRNCTVVTLTKEGNELGSFSTDKKILSISASNDRAAILSYGELNTYNAYGDLFDSCSVGTDSKAVLLPQNKTAYILGVTGIQKIDFKAKK